MRSVLLIILITGVFADAITTYIAFTRYGCLVERNPITRATCELCNYNIAVVVGSILEFAILYFLFKIYELKAGSLKEYFMGFVSMLPMIATINNIIFLLTH